MGAVSSCTGSTMRTAEQSLKASSLALAVPRRQKWVRRKGQRKRTKQRPRLIPTPRCSVPNWLPDAAESREQERVRDSPALKRLGQRAGDMLLPNQVAE